MEKYHLILWAVIFVLTVIAELSTVQLVSVWFAVGAIAAFIAAFFLPFWCQLVIFVIVSALFLVLTRRFFKKFAGPLIPTNIDKEIGSKATVIEAIDHDNKTGRVRLGDVDWNARSVDGSPAEIGETVVVKDISGTCLIIERYTPTDDSRILNKYNKNIS